MVENVEDVTLLQVFGFGKWKSLPNGQIKYAESRSRKLFTTQVDLAPGPVITYFAEALTGV